MRVPEPSRAVEQQTMVLNLLREHGPQTRNQLKDQTGFSISLVRQLTESLLEHDLIIEDGRAGEDSPGRPAKVWSVAPDAAFVAGLDVGGTTTRFVIIDALGDVTYRHTAPTVKASAAHELLRHMVSTVQDGLRAFGETAAEVRRLGVAFSGFVDFQAGYSIDAPNIASARALPLKQRLERELNLETLVDDSSRVMALAEMRYGVARDSSNFICLNVGTGIGSGVIINGELFRGVRGLAGEIGHMPVAPGGAPCYCGKLGCLESMASGRAIARYAHEALSAGTTSKIRDLTDGDINAVSAKTVTEAAQQDDELAISVLRKAAAYLGVGVATAVNLFSPDKLILTGGVMRGNEVLFDMVCEEAQQHTLRQLPEPFPVLLTELDAQAAALGAATLALDAEFSHGFAARLSESIQQS